MEVGGVWDLRLVVVEVWGLCGGDGDGEFLEGEGVGVVFWVG